MRGSSRLILATYGMRRFLDAMLSSPLRLPMSIAPHQSDRVRCLGANLNARDSRWSWTRSVTLHCLQRCKHRKHTTSLEAPADANRPGGFALFSSLFAYAVCGGVGHR